jgi:hypothetical protein
MALLEANGLSVVSGCISMPIEGAWHTDLVVDATTADQLAGAVTLSIADRELELKGTARLRGAFADAASVRVMAGADGLKKSVTPRHYNNAIARQVFGDILGDAGETLASTADAAALASLLPSWAIIGAPAGLALTRLVGALGAIWRVLPDGSVWFGTDTWPELTFEHAIVHDYPERGVLELESEAPLLRPGVTFEGRRIYYVEHRIEGRHLETTAWYDETQRGRAPLVASVRGALPQIDYLTTYRAKVVAQSADGKTLDLQPDDARLPGMQQVPLRLGLPGVIALLAPGAFVEVGWDGGDPSQPHAKLFEGGETVTKLVVKATMVYLGDEAGAKQLVTKDEYDLHTHKYNPGPGGLAESVVPSVLATGTLNVRAK